MVSRLMTTRPAVLCSGLPTAATPTGLSTRVPSPSSRVGARAPSALMAAVVAPPSQATGRQRGDGSRPLGNSRGVKSRARAMVGYQAQELNQPA
jgi:hypothetical protein